jgi:CRISPR-associated protein Cmr6
MANKHYLFYTEYFEHLDNEQLFKDHNEKLTNSEFSKTNIIDIQEAFQSQNDYFSFYGTTLYPGLLLGLGYFHDYKSDEVIRNGFSFDYVTGLPYIPGSTVKGMLRSAFRNYESIVKQFLPKKIVSENIAIDKLEKAIFGDWVEAKDEIVPSLKSRDVFFDAIVVQTFEKNKHILGEEYITPHEKPLEEPKPIKLLKVLPDVVFKFSFKLQDTLIDEENGVKLKAKDKKELFGKLIETFGIGAKTNVGFGGMKTSNSPYRCERCKKNYVGINRKTNKPHPICADCNEKPY